MIGIIFSYSKGLGTSDGEPLRQLKVITFEENSIPVRVLLKKRR